MYGTFAKYWIVSFVVSVSSQSTITACGSEEVEKRGVGIRFDMGSVRFRKWWIDLCICLYIFIFGKKLSRFICFKAQNIEKIQFNIF